MTRTAAVVCALLLSVLRGTAQDDIIRYDRIGERDGQLLAATIFPGELRIFHAVRFTPREPCLLTGAMLMFSVVRFQELAGEDTLEVLVYEYEPSRNILRSISASRLVALGDSGFPRGNVNAVNPLTSRLWDVLTVPFQPPIPIAPQRDFLIGVSLRSLQSMAVGPGTWNGFTVMIDTYSPDYQRSFRYRICDDLQRSGLYPATDAAYAALALRAMVHYDSTLRDTVLAGAGDAPHAAAPAAPHAVADDGSAAAIGAPYPEPCALSTVLPITLSEACHATLTVHDALGRLCATALDADLPAGTHPVRVSAAALPPGVYFARLRAGSAVALRRITLTR